MNSIDDLRKKITEIEKKLNYSFQDKTFLETAFIHRSFFNESRYECKEHNERLEFLGDALLNVLVTQYLFKTFPEHTEGELSYLRSQLVDASSCAFYLETLDLGDYLLMGRGEKMNLTRGRETMHADLFEALLGAMYLDGGLAPLQDLLFTTLLEKVSLLLNKPRRNWKAEFQEYSQKWFQKPPYYQIIEEKGPDHQKTFLVKAFIEETAISEGIGNSKKEAEQDAASKGLAFLQSLGSQ